MVACKEGQELAGKGKQTVGKSLCRKREMAAFATNRNHAEPKGQYLEPENQHKLSEPCAPQEAPISPN
jgi:hypothetical protein